MDQIGLIRRLKGRQGKSEREIARITGLSRNTVAKWLRGQAQEPKYRRPAVSGKLTAFGEQLIEALRADARRLAVHCSSTCCPSCTSTPA
jgi:transcriptional regulator with XRE-family HTH domain